MNKKAQFFLIAALIIAAIILAFAQIYNQAGTSGQEVYVYEFSNEFYYEASQVIDNGIITSAQPSDITERLANLTEYYGDINPDSDIVIIYGNESQLSEIKYDSSLGDSGESQTADVSKFSPDEIIDLGNNEKRIPVRIKDKDKPDKEIKREFDIKKGENFYIVIRKKIQNEQFVIAK